MDGNSEIGQKLKGQRYKGVEPKNDIENQPGIGQKLNLSLYFSKGRVRIRVSRAVFFGAYAFWFMRIDKRIIRILYAVYADIRIYGKTQKCSLCGHMCICA